MTKYALTLTALLGALALTAAGCGSSGNGNNTPDANGGGGGDGGGGNADAAPSADAPNATDYMGLGEACTSAATCPTFPSAAQCLTSQGATVGLCSFECATDEKVTTDANGNLQVSAIPQADHTKCSDAYTGDGGVAVCGLITAENPMTPGANAQVTISASCAVFCDSTGAKECPDGTTCQGGLCLE